MKTPKVKMPVCTVVDGALLACRKTMQVAGQNERGEQAARAEQSIAEKSAEQCRGDSKWVPGQTPFTHMAPAPFVLPLNQGSVVKF